MDKAEGNLPEEEKKKKKKKKTRKEKESDSDAVTDNKQQYTIINNYYKYYVDNCQGLAVGNNSTCTVNFQPAENEKEVRREFTQYFKNPKVAEKTGEMTLDIVLIAMLKYLLHRKGKMILQRLETEFEKFNGKDFKNYTQTETRLVRFLQNNQNHFSLSRDGNKWFVEINTGTNANSQQQQNDANNEPIYSMPERLPSGASREDCGNSSGTDQKAQTISMITKRETQYAISDMDSRASSENVFKPKETRDPDEFLKEMNHFRKGNYVLLTCKNTYEYNLESLAMIPWFAVYDFDEKSREDGLLSILEEKIKSFRALYICTWNEKPKLAGYSTMWCLMRGSTQEANSRTPDDPKQWSRQVRKGIEYHLEELVKNTELCSVLKIVVIWPDNEDLIEYLHIFIGRLEAIIEPTMILVESNRRKSRNEESIIDMMKPNYTLYTELRDLCQCVRKSMGKVQENRKQLIYQLKTSSGDNDPKIDEAFASSLRENLEVLYLNTNPYGKTSFNIDEIKEEEDRFFRGANLRWSAYYECGPGHFDAERDITCDIVHRISNGFVEQFKSGFVTLFHAPGAGGTTLAQRVLWDLSRNTPCAKLILTFRSKLTDIARQIEALYQKTHLPIVLLIDGIEEQKAQYLMSSLEKVIVVILHVRQHPYKMDVAKLKENEFWLPGEVSEKEAKTLVAKFFNKCDTKEKKEKLEELVHEVINNIPRYMFEFGLTVYLDEYKGLQSYVKGYLMLRSGELETWQKVLGYLSLVYYYGQVSMPCQLFATMLRKPPNYDMELDDFGDFVKEFVVPCDDEGRRNDIRIGHHAVAKEILQQILTRHIPQDQSKNRDLWQEAKRHLQRFSLTFIDFLKTKKSRCNKTSGTIFDIITKVFIVRDYEEVSVSDIQTKKKMMLSRLIDDIYSPPPSVERVQIFEKLTEAFPENPNFHAHLGRIYGIYQPENEQKAEDCYQKALELCKDSVNPGNDDEIEDSMKHTLMHVYHMYGMFYVRKITRFTGRNPGEEPRVHTAKNEYERRSGELLQWAIMACDLFSDGRKKTPLGSELSYGYIGEIRARLHICDFVLRNAQFKTLTDLMAKSKDQKISNFVKESCTFVIELIMECYGVVDHYVLGKEFYRMVEYHNKLFQNQYPQLDNFRMSEEDTCTRRLQASLIKMKYTISDNFHTIDNITSSDDLSCLVKLYEANMRDSENLGVENNRRALDLDYKDWMFAIRSKKYTGNYTVEEVLIRVRQWHRLLNSPTSTYYLFVLLSILGFGMDHKSGNSELLIEAMELKENLKVANRYRKMSAPRIPWEWLGVGDGIRCLIPNQIVPKDTEKSKPNQNAPTLVRLKGTITRPNDKVQSGFIALDLGHNPIQINAFFVPIRTKDKLVGQAYAGKRVEFALGFSISEGYGAYEVFQLQQIQCNQCKRKVEMKSDEDSVQCRCGQILQRTVD